MDRAVKGPSVAAGEVAARRAVIRHEHSVARKDGVADDIGQAGRGVAGHMQHRRLQPADLEPVTVVEQVVELAAVAAEVGPLVEDLAEDLLHGEDFMANRQLTAELFLEIGRRRQVIGMGVRLEQPLNRETFGFYVINERIGRSVRGAPGRRIIVEHAVDDGAGVGGGIAHDMADGEGGFVEERLDYRALARITQCGANDVGGVVTGGVGNWRGHDVSPLR